MRTAGSLLVLTAALGCAAASDAGSTSGDGESADQAGTDQPFQLVVNASGTPQILERPERGATASLTVTPTASQSGRTITVQTPEIQLAPDAALLRLAGRDRRISLMQVEYRSADGAWLPVLAPQKTLDTGRQVPDGRWLWSEFFWTSSNGKTEIDADAWHVDTIQEGVTASFAVQAVRKTLSVPGTELRVLVIPHDELDLSSFTVELQRSMP